jgi:hypothetical protein
MALVVVASLAVSGPALAAPLSPALQAELLALYQRYGEAMAAGRLEAGLALRDTKSRAEAARETRTAAGRRDYLEEASATRPDALEVVHGQVAKTGEVASLITLVTKRTAEAPGGVMRAGLTLRFVRERGGWRLADQTFGPDPKAASACPDERNEAAAAYDADRQVSVGGPIARVVFNADHTLVVVRVVDEPACLFLPPRAGLAAIGVAADTLAPYAQIAAHARPHRGDTHKLLAIDATVTAEDETL